MIVPLLVLVATLGVALAALLVQARRQRADAARTGPRLAQAEARIEASIAAGRAALGPVAPDLAHGDGGEPRSDASERRPGRRARRATAIPDRP